MPANLHILSMLIQNADRTTYGINKIVVFVLAFVVFFVECDVPGQLAI